MISPAPRTPAIGAHRDRIHPDRDRPRVRAHHGRALRGLRRGVGIARRGRHRRLPCRGRRLPSARRRRRGPRPRRHPRDLRGVLAQWPDLEFSEQDSHLGDWGWVVRWTMSGTLAASGEVAHGAAAEAGARFAVDAVDVIEVSGGELTAKHTYVDSQTLLAQIGAAD